MDNAQRRIHVATLLREFGHEFVGREISDEDLDAIAEQVQNLLDGVARAPLRQRSVPSESAEGFKMTVPSDGRVERHQLFADSVVSGGANPMGLGAYLWREGDVAVMEVTLGNAFEGAPGRSHGGVVASLIDETMGLVMGMQGALAFTAQLDITYRAPTPINKPITARAWLESRSGRKLTIRATVASGEGLVAEATALFIEVDPATFLEHIIDA
jgi:acyl-coenzyme A thioesterase PaaI-like protein